MKNKKKHLTPHPTLGVKTTKPSSTGISGLPIASGAVGIFRDVLLPDGTREPMMVCGNPATGQYRVRTNDGCWNYGYITTTERGSEFQQSTDQPLAGDYPLNPLVTSLTADKKIKAVLANQDLAEQLVAGLTNVTWTNGRSLCSMNHVEAGNFVADIRDKRECYSDLVLAGRPGFVTIAIWDLLENYGWYPVNPRKNPENSALLVQILAICEARKHRPIEPWVHYHHEETTTSDTEIGRMIRCCFNGQATLTEWELYFLNIAAE